MAIELFSGPRIAGCGMWVPEHALSNKELIAKYGIDSNDQWIKDHVGIGSRRILKDTRDHKRATSYMATEAAKIALEDADMKANKIDGVILATVTGDYGDIPASSTIVQSVLGINGFAFDVNAGCAGFIHAMIVAKNLIETGDYKNILVIGAETLSRVTNWRDRNTCILFGDGAGAIIMQYSDSPVTRMAFDMKSMGNSSLLYTPAGGSLDPLTPKALLENQHCIHMNGNPLARLAIKEMSESLNVTLKKAGTTFDHVKSIVPHQANIFIINKMIEREKLDPEQVVVWLKEQKAPLDFITSDREQIRKRSDSLPQVLVNIDRYGNTSAASIPIALAEADARGKKLAEFERKRKFEREFRDKEPDTRGALMPNDPTVLVGFGAGPTRASIYLKWKENLNETTPYKVMGRFRRLFRIPFPFLRKRVEETDTDLAPAA